MTPVPQCSFPAQTTPPLHCHLLRCTAELEEFSAAWEALWLADKHATPFQHPAWLIPWWMAFGAAQPGRELCCVVLSELSAPEDAVAFLPFYILDDPGTGERQHLLLGAGTSDYLDGIFSDRAADVCEGYCRAGLLHLLAGTHADVLHAAQLRPSSPLLSAMHGLSSASRPWPSGSAYIMTAWAGEATSTLPAARWHDLPMKIRRNAMYYSNRAQRQAMGLLRSRGR